MPSVDDAAEALARVCGPMWTDVDQIIKNYLAVSTADVLNEGLEFLENVLCPFLLNLKMIATEREGEALCERLTDMLGGRSHVCTHSFTTTLYRLTSARRALGLLVSSFSTSTSKRRLRLTRNALLVPPPPPSPPPPPYP